MLDHLLAFERENSLSLLKLARYLGTDIGGVLWLAQAPAPRADGNEFHAAVALLAELSGADVGRLAGIVNATTPAHGLPAAA